MKLEFDLFVPYGNTILPECISLLGLLIIFSIDLTSDRRNITSLYSIALGSLLITTIILLFGLETESVITPSSSLEADGFSKIFQLLVVLSSTICIFISIEYIECTKSSTTEPLVFLLTGTIGGMFLCGANDLVTISVSLECSSLCSYSLCSYTGKDIRSNEAAIKYLPMGGLSSSILAYGFSWLYGSSGGETNMQKVVNGLLLYKEIINPTGLSIAFICIIIGLAFKLSLVPFHQWTPDIYEGSPTPVVAFLSVTSKIASIALTTRILNTLSIPSTNEWKLVLEILAISSMLMGNLVAITQTSMKRMLAYSPISQMGYIIIGLITGNSDGYTSMIVYIFFYIFMSLGTFACVISFGLRTGTDNIRDYEGLYVRDPLLGICLILCILSLGGIPPLTGFFGKLYLFRCGWQAGFYLLVVIALTTSIISIYYYLKIVKSIMYSKKKQLNPYIETYIISSTFFTQKNFIKYIISLCTIGSIFLGLVINPLRYYVQEIIELSTRSLN
nr:NADH-plastoquinone oxidoreductase subunit 2 [Aneura maxima]WGO60020.1 NADH-plastoquinone oxidoreductase subunit 2 [Aneura maxima]